MYAWTSKGKIYDGKYIFLSMLTTACMDVKKKEIIACMNFKRKRITACMDFKRKKTACILAWSLFTKALI